MLILKLLLIGVFSLIFVQDSKDRKVFWFLFPVVGVLVIVLQINAISLYPALLNAVFNLGFVSLLLVVCLVYAKLKLRQPFLTEVFGWGDILFFVAIAFSFSIVSFLILFVFALLFSLLLHLVCVLKQGVAVMRIVKQRRKGLRTKLLKKKMQ